MCVPALQRVAMGSPCKDCLLRRNVGLTLWPAHCQLRVRANCVSGPWKPTKQFEAKKQNEKKKKKLCPHFRHSRGRVGQDTSLNLLVCLSHTLVCLLVYCVFCWLSCVVVVEHTSLSLLLLWTLWTLRLVLGSWCAWWWIVTS